MKFVNFIRRIVFPAILSVFVLCNFSVAQVLSKPVLRDIEKYAARLTSFTEELHKEYHEHLENVKHAEKIENDVSALEKIAKSLSSFAQNAEVNKESMKRLRADTNELLQLSWQIVRTVDIAENWTPSHDRKGIVHMREVAAQVIETTLAIDRFLPPDTNVIDGQVERMENLVKELHKEFHEHLEGYEVSKHLDEDLEDLENEVEHIHDHAHNKSWRNIELKDILDETKSLRATTKHIESLFVRQGEIGVRKRDFIGIEHSRDAISDVLASAKLLEHMIYKADPNLAPRLHRDHNRFDDRNDRRPIRDR